MIVGHYTTIKETVNSLVDACINYVGFCTFSGCSYLNLENSLIDIYLFGLFAMRVFELKS